MHHHEIQFIRFIKIYDIYNIKYYSVSMVIQSVRLWIYLSLFCSYFFSTKLL